MDAHSKGIIDKLGKPDPSPYNVFTDFSIVSSVTNKHFCSREIKQGFCPLTMGMQRSGNDRSL